MASKRISPRQRPRHYGLEVWQEAMRIVREVYRETDAFPQIERHVLVTQLKRTAISVPSNIAEGAGRGGRSELVRFLTIARASLAELDTQLWIARDRGYLVDAVNLHAAVQLLYAKLNALIKTHRLRISA